MICCQEGINDSEVKGMVKFKFKHYYKILWGSIEVTLGYLRFELVQSKEHQATLPPMSMRPNESSIETMMAVRTRVRFMEVTPKPCVTQEEFGEVVGALGTKFPTHVVTIEKQKANGASLGITMEPTN